MSVDIGTGYIKAAAGEVINQEIRLLGIAKVRSTGLRNGSVVDIESTAHSIDQVLNELERLAGIEVYSALIGFSGVNIDVFSNRTAVAIGNLNQGITEDDKNRVLQMAQDIELPSGRIILQTLERQYVVDGYEGVKDPIGMKGNRLEADILLIVGNVLGVQNISRSAERINLHIDRILYNPLLVAESVLLPAEKEMGIVLIDIGEGTIEVNYFAYGNLCYTLVIPLAGGIITRDLAIVLRTSMEEAAGIKESYSIINSSIPLEDKMLEIKNIQGKETRQVTYKMVCDVIFARVEEIVQMIYTALYQFGCLDKIPGGIVLTGGGAKLDGLAEFIADNIGVSVRMGYPELLKSVPAEYNDLQNAAVTGGLIYAAQNRILSADDTVSGGIVRKINFWVKELLG